MFTRQILQSDILFCQLNQNTLICTRTATDIPVLLPVNILGDTYKLGLVSMGIILVPFS